MSEQFDKKISAEFLLNNSLESSQIKSAILRFCCLNSSRSWRWVIDDLSHEHLYGLSRAIQLVPGDLAIAISAKFAGPVCGDGTFLIRHLLNVFNLYSSTISDASEPNMMMVKNIYALTPAARDSFTEHGQNLTLSWSVAEVGNLLAEVLRCVETDVNNLRPTIRRLLEVCEDISSMCTAYTYFIRPVWDFHRLSSGFSHAEPLRETATVQISSCHYKFINSFRRLNPNFTI